MVESGERERERESGKLRRHRREVKNLDQNEGWRSTHREDGSNTKRGDKIENEKKK